VVDKTLIPNVVRDLLDRARCPREEDPSLRRG